MKRLREIFPHSNEEPTHFVMTKWFEDENSRGSYSFPAVGGGSRGKIRKERKVEEGERRCRREEYLLFFFFFLLFFNLLCFIFLNLYLFVYADIINLLEPIQTRFGMPRVMFAGEATDPVYYGTTHAGTTSLHSSLLLLSFFSLSPSILHPSSIAESCSLVRPLMKTLWHHP